MRLPFACALVLAKIHCEGPGWHLSFTASSNLRNLLLLSIWQRVTKSWKRLHPCQTFVWTKVWRGAKAKVLIWECLMVQAVPSIYWSDIWLQSDLSNDSTNYKSSNLRLHCTPAISCVSTSFIFLQSLPTNLLESTLASSPAFSFLPQAKWRVYITDSYWVHLPSPHPHTLPYIAIHCHTWSHMPQARATIHPEQPRSCSGQANTWSRVGETQGCSMF